MKSQFFSRTQKSDGARTTLLNWFCYHKGLDALITLLNTEIEHPKTKENTGCPFELYELIFILSKTIKDTLDTAIVDNFEKLLEQSLLNRIKNISNSELRRTDKEKPFKLIKENTDFLKNVYKENADGFINDILLDLTLK